MMHIDFGKRRIEFDVRYEAKQWFRVTVDPEGLVHVVVPEGKSTSDIIKKVRKKAPWIIRQQAYFERFRPNPVARSYVAGRVTNKP